VASPLVRGARRAVVGASRLPPVSAVVASLARRDRGRPDRLAVLTYHRVGTAEDGGYPGIVSATTATFAEQMAWLAEDYHPISLAELLARRDGGPALPKRAVLVTFDDAYRCFASEAWPILRAQGVPAALFVPTAYPGNADRDFWWDRLYRAVHAAPAVAGEAVRTTPLGPVDTRSPDAHRRSFAGLRDAVKALPHDEAMAAVLATVEQLGGVSPRPSVLDWPTLRSLQAEGVAMGVHSRTHPLLDRLPVERLDDEIDGARQDLERELGRVEPAIAYPNGNHSPAVLAAVERAGLRLGFTTQRGTEDLTRPAWLTIRRINVGSGASRAILQAQLQGWFDRWI
jgi:peptidoglycan/xylan/chitin deacetylase (PgdA/CDA1 family)